MFALNGNNSRSNSNNNIGLRAACLSHLNRTVKAEPIIKRDKGDASGLTKVQSKILILCDGSREEPAQTTCEISGCHTQLFFIKDLGYGG